MQATDLVSLVLERNKSERTFHRGRNGRVWRFGRGRKGEESEIVGMEIKDRGKGRRRWVKRR